MNVEKQIEEAAEIEKKKGEAVQFEIESLRKKLEKMTGIVQSHVTAVNPKHDKAEKDITDLQDRLKVDYVFNLEKFGRCIVYT